MPFIPFTEEQKLKAASVDLPSFLRTQGVELERSGHEFRLQSDPYITVKDNHWYDQAEQRGGNAISLVRRMYNMDYPDAVTMLLEGTSAQPLALHGQPREKQRKSFELPQRHTDQRRVYAYLIKHRQIPADIVTHFVKAKMLYESAEPSKDGKSVYHNAVFLGCDEKGQVRHAHKHGLNTFGASYKGSIGGSVPEHSFHYTGASKNLYVFEAPIDLLSFIALHPDNWQEHSYVALCGTSPKAMLHQLASNPAITNVFVCLDNDERGMAAAKKLLQILEQRDGIAVSAIFPRYKDWNVDRQILCRAGPEVGQTQSLLGVALGMKMM